MATEPSIAFVVLTWNSQAFAESCIRSILELGYAHCAVLVFENGSTDNTPHILAQLEQEDPRVIVVRSEQNVGTTVSRNTLIRLVPPEFDYVCVLDSDTVVNREALDTLVCALERHPEVGVVGPAMANANGELQLSGRNLPTVGIKLGKVCPLSGVREQAAQAEIPNTPVEDGLQDVGYLLSACWLVPRHVFDVVGLLDERIFYAPEDVDWCLRARLAGYRVCHCPDARIIHDYQRISRKRLVSRTNLSHLAGLAHYFSKHRYLWDTSKAV